MDLKMGGPMGNPLMPVQARCQPISSGPELNLDSEAKHGTGSDCTKWYLLLQLGLAPKTWGPTKTNVPPPLACIHMPVSGSNHKRYSPFGQKMSLVGPQVIAQGVGPGGGSTVGAEGGEEQACGVHKGGR